MIQIYTKIHIACWYLIAIYLLTAFENLSYTHGVDALAADIINSTRVHHRLTKDRAQASQVDRGAGVACRCCSDGPTATTAPTHTANTRSSSHARKSHHCWAVCNCIRVCPLLSSRMHMHMHMHRHTLTHTHKHGLVTLARSHSHTLRRTHTRTHMPLHHIAATQVAGTQAHLVPSQHIMALLAGKC